MIETPCLGVILDGICSQHIVVEHGKGSYSDWGRKF